MLIHQSIRNPIINSLMDRIRVLRNRITTGTMTIRLEGLIGTRMMIGTITRNMNIIIMIIIGLEIIIGTKILTRMCLKKSAIQLTILESSRKLISSNRKLISSNRKLISSNRKLINSNRSILRNWIDRSRGERDRTIWNSLMRTSYQK